jgi:hypothetical protein
MEEEYAPIHLDYENSNNSNYQSDESIPSITFNGNQSEVVIPEFINNRDEYLFFEFMTNQISHALNPAINEIEPIIYEETINEPEFTA